MLLTLEKVEKKTDGKLIIPELSLEISRGKIIGLLGQNGSGKTTLLKLISGHSRPTKGIVRFHDHPYRYPQTSWTINYLPDSLFFPNNYKVLDALNFYTTNFPDFSREKAKRILVDLGIELPITIQNMSKGQQERLTLALVLSRSSQLTLLDEPLAAIDVLTRDEILTLLTRYVDPNSTIIITTHLIFDMQEFFDEVIFLDKGAIVLYENTKLLQQNHGMDILTYYRNFFNLSTPLKGGL